MLLGTVLIILNFLMFVYLTEYTQNMKDLTPFTRQLYSAGVGAINGATIFVLQEIYNFISLYVINWENHKYNSELENSYLVKTFIFNFFVSYIGLFYYAFIKRTGSEDQSSLNILGLNFASLVIVKNLTAMGKLNIKPFIFFWFKNILFKKKWIPHRAQRKKAFVI